MSMSASPIVLGLRRLGVFMAPALLALGACDSDPAPAPDVADVAAPEPDDVAARPDLPEDVPSPEGDADLSPPLGDAQETSDGEGEETLLPEDAGLEDASGEVADADPEDTVAGDSTGGEDLIPGEDTGQGDVADPCEGEGEVPFRVAAEGSGGYNINGDINPTLTVVRGCTYTFVVNASGHPFFIKAAQTLGTRDAFDDGVTNNGIASGILTWEVAEDTPDSLFYICEFHAAMTGLIEVITR